MEHRMIEHNGIRYRPEDAKRLGITEVEDKAERTPAADKAARPSKGGSRAGRSKPGGSPAAGDA